MPDNTIQESADSRHVREDAPPDAGSRHNVLSFSLSSPAEMLLGSHEVPFPVDYFCIAQSRKRRPRLVEAIEPRQNLGNCGGAQ